MMLHQYGTKGNQRHSTQSGSLVQHLS